MFAALADPTRRAIVVRLAEGEASVSELTEPFAVQVLTWCDELGVAADDPRLNPYGGAIACGHPLAATGVRLVAQLAGKVLRVGQDGKTHLVIPLVVIHKRETLRSFERSLCCSF